MPKYSRSSRMDGFGGRFGAICAMPVLSPVFLVYDLGASWPTAYRRLDKLPSGADAFSAHARDKGGYRIPDLCVWQERHDRRMDRCANLHAQTTHAERTH